LAQICGVFFRDYRTRIPQFCANRRRSLARSGRGPHP
jgi:hypothetical protein